MRTGFSDVATSLKPVRFVGAASKEKSTRGVLFSLWLGNGLDFISRRRTPFHHKSSVFLPFLCILVHLIKSIWFHLAFLQTWIYSFQKGLNRFIFFFRNYSVRFREKPLN